MPWCSSFVPPLFLLCSSFVPPLFLLCSSFVPPLFLLCSSYVPPMFLLCSSFVPPMFLLCSSYVPPLCLLCSSYVPPLLFLCCSFVVAPAPRRSPPALGGGSNDMDDQGEEFSGFHVRKSGSQLDLARLAAERRLVRQISDGKMDTDTASGPPTPLNWSTQSIQGDAAYSCGVFGVTLPLVRDGVLRMVDDSFTKCFHYEPPRPWNWNWYLCEFKSPIPLLPLAFPSLIPYICHANFNSNAWCSCASIATLVLIVG